MLILTTSALQMRMDKGYKLLHFKGTWIQKLVFEDGGVLFLIEWFFSHSGSFRTPSENFFYGKILSSLFEEGQFFLFVFFNGYIYFSSQLLSIHKVTYRT